MSERFGFFKDMFGKPKDEEKKKTGFLSLDLNDASKAEEQKRAYEKERREVLRQQYNNDYERVMVGHDRAGNPQYEWMPKDQAEQARKKLEEQQAELDARAASDARHAAAVPARPAPAMTYPSSVRTAPASPEVPAPGVPAPTEAPAAPVSAEVRTEEVPAPAGPESVAPTTARVSAGPVAPESYGAAEPRKKERLVVADVSKIVESIAERQAREKVEELRNELKNSGFLKRTLGRGLLRFNENGYFIKFYKEARQQMIENRNLMAEIEGRLTGKISAREATLSSDAEYRSYQFLDKVVEEYQKDLVEAQEKGNVIENNNLTHACGELFARHAMGRFATRAEFEKAAHEAIANSGIDAEQFSVNGRKDAKGHMYATNLWDMAERYRLDVEEKIKAAGPERERAVREFVNGTLSIDIMLGTKERDLYNCKPEKVLERYNGFVNFTQSLGVRVPVVGKALSSIVANPFFYGAVGTLATRGALRKMGVIATTATLGPAFGALAVGAGISGIYGAARRGRDLKSDRALTLNRQTLGAQPAEGKQGKKLEEFNYQLMEAEGIVNYLNELKDKALSQNDQAYVAEVLARVQVEREKGVDLISVQGQEGEKYKTKYLQMVNLKEALVGLGDEYRDYLQKSSGELTENHPLRDLVEQHKQELIKQIETQDKQFEKYKTKEKWKSGVAAALGGAAAGAIAQFGYDVIASKGDFSGNHPVAQEWYSAKGKSIIRGVIEKIHAPEDVHYGGALADQHLPWMKGEFKLPGDLRLVDQTHGLSNSFDIVDGKGNVIADNIEVGPDGKIPAGTLAELQQKGIPIQEIPGTGQNGVPDINALKQYFTGLDKHARVDWHDEKGAFWSTVHKATIEFEGKQQMLYLEKDVNGQVSVNARGVIRNLTENIKERLQDPNFGLNPDGTVDSKLMHIKSQLESWVNAGELEKHLQVAVIPTEGANKQGLSWLVENARNGKVALPKELSDRFGSPESLKYLKHPFKYIELRLDGHVVATSTGADMQLPTGGPGYEILPFARPHLPHEIEPPIPLPLNRRKEVGPVQWPKMVYGEYGYGGEHGADRGFFETRRSEALRRNPDLQLNHFVEIERYFTKQPRQYVAEVQRLAGEMGNPMSPDCRLAVCIPVAGHQEGENIYRTLENYTHQTANKEAFEIVLFVNHPDKDLSGRTVTPDATLAEIERFRRDYPDMQVKVMYKVFPKNDAKIGNIRKYLNDAVLWRHHERGMDAKDLIMVSNDADCKGVAPTYIQNFIEKFDSNPRTDAYLGQLDWDPEVYVKNPLVHIGTRLMQYQEAQIRRKGLHIASSGANFAFRSSIYAGVGGYPSEYDIAEDVGLGRAIKFARSGSKDPHRKAVGFAGARTSRLYTSARRALNAVRRGEAPIDQWDAGFSAFDDEVRKLKLGDLDKGLDFGNSEQVRAFVQDLEVIINKTIVKSNAWYDNKYREEIYKALDWLGIKVEVVDEKSVKIVNADTLLRGLKDYQRDGLRLMRIKSGKEASRSRTVRSETESKPASAVPESAPAEPLSGEPVPETAPEADARREAAAEFRGGPFQYIYGNKLSQAAAERGMSERDYIRSLYEQSGKVEEFRQLENVTRAGRGRNAERNLLYQLTGLLAMDNPQLLQEWRGSEREGYERWAVEAAYSGIRPKLESRTLTEADVDEVANQFGIESEKIAESALERTGRLGMAEQTYRNAAARNSRFTREQALKKLLVGYQEAAKRGQRVPTDRDLADRAVRRSRAQA